jgi:hypothetical protein
MAMAEKRTNPPMEEAIKLRRTTSDQPILAKCCEQVECTRFTLKNADRPKAMLLTDSTRVRKNSNTDSARHTSHAGTKVGPLTQAFTACRFSAYPLVPLTQAFTAYRLPKQSHFCGDVEWD